MDLLIFDNFDLKFQLTNQKTFSDGKLDIERQHLSDLVTASIHPSIFKIFLGLI
jgi:hypothetical protein